MSQTDPGRQIGGYSIQRRFRGISWGSEVWGWGGRDNLAEARMRASHISPLFRPRGLSHFKHGGFATWLHMVAQIPTVMAQIPTGRRYKDKNWCWHDRDTRFTLYL